MFSTRRLNAIAATAIAGVIGTVGLVAAGPSGESATSDVPPPAPAAATASTTTASTSPEAASASATSTRTSSPPSSDTTADVSAMSGDSPAPALPVTPSPEPTNPPVDPEPVDPESPAPGEPGVVDGDEGSTDPTPPPPPPPPVGPTELVGVPKPPPPLPPIPGPVDLTTPPMDPGPPPIDDLVAELDPTPWSGPNDFQVTPLPAHLGTITSGLSGCQLECVTTALLSSNALDANVTLEATTTVPVHFEIDVEETDGDWGKQFNNPGYDTAWTKTLGPLQPETTYDLILIAIDQNGHSRTYEHQFTTVAIIDGFASNAEGCALECITTGTVQTDGAANAVEVHVKTNTPAALQVWFSTSEPTWVDDPAAKPAYGPVYDSDSPSTSTTFDVTDLEFDTLYHVVARAHDEHGEHYRVGTFRTDPSPFVDVLVTFEEITVTHDGDSGSLNRGELAFSWGFDGVGIGWRSEEKMHAGTVSIGGNNAEWFRFDPATESIPNPTVAAHERDPDGLVEFCGHGWGPGTEPRYTADCDEKTNVAHYGGPIGLDQILELPWCADIGHAEAGIGTRCAVLGSAVFGTRDDDYAHFSTIVSFWVVD